MKRPGPFCGDLSKGSGRRRISGPSQGGETGPKRPLTHVRSLAARSGVTQVRTTWVT